MKVSKMVEILQGFPQDLDVMISDGYNLEFYSGEYDIQLWESEDGTKCVDVGIGGLSIYDE